MDSKGRRAVLGAALLAAAAATCGASLESPPGDVARAVAVGSMTVRYFDSGPSRGPPVVLLHGGGLTSQMWRPFAAAAAAAGLRAYSMETRNHGGTNNPGNQFGYQILAEDLDGFLSALNIERPMLVGYSDGGIIAQTWLLLHPDRARAVVIGGATHRVAADAHYMAGLKSFYGFDGRGRLPDQALDALEVANPDFATRLKTLHATLDDTDRWRRLHQLAWPTWTTRRVTPLSAYRRTRTPVLVILGENDEFFRVTDAVELAAALPNGELAVLPGTGHSAFRERPAIFNAIVIDFLRRSLP